MKAGTLLNAGLLDYQQAWDLQKQLHQQRVKSEIGDTLIMTEHPHTYTLGKTAREAHLVAEESALQKQGVNVYRIDRGGDITYHGPGQIVGYPILDLHDHYLDMHRYLRELEQVIIDLLSDYGIQAGREEGLTGVWVDGAKVAAIGVKVTRWVTMHGFALNVNTDLSYFSNIIPCGIVDKPVTSMQQLVGKQMNFADVVERVISHFSNIFRIEFIVASRRSVSRLQATALV